MTPEHNERLKALIRTEGKFNDDATGIRGKIPMAGELAISAGTLQGPARALFISEVEYSTLRYVVIAGSTPIMWRGAFEWTVPPRRWIKYVDPHHYLLMLEVLNEQESEAGRTP